MFSTGTCVQEPVFFHLSACVHLQRRSLWNHSPARLWPWCGSSRHLSCRIKLRVQPVHHGHLGLYHREPKTRFLYDSERVYPGLLNLCQCESRSLSLTTESMYSMYDQSLTLLWGTTCKVQYTKMTESLFWLRFLFSCISRVKFLTNNINIQTRKVKRGS